LQSSGEKLSMLRRTFVLWKSSKEEIWICYLCEKQNMLENENHNKFLIKKSKSSAFVFATFRVSSFPLTYSEFLIIREFLNFNFAIV
jgi:hypothetical protein